MDFKTMLSQLSQLSEATEKTPTGRVHKAEPGGYGRKFDTDEEGEEQKKVEPPVKRGRGRPRKGADITGQVKKYEFGPLSKAMGMASKAPELSAQGKKIAKKHSLKEWVQEVEDKLTNEALATGQKPIPVVSKAGDTQQTGAGFLNITDTSPTGQALQKALSDLASQKKAQIVVPTTPQAGQPAAGSTGQAPTGTQPVKEKWAGDAKIHATGEYSGKSVEELKSMLAKLKKTGPHPEDSPEAKKQRQINFALRAKGGWKKGEGAAQKESMGEGEIPSVAGIDTRGAGLGAGRSATTLESKKRVTESSHKHNAAKLLGKHHALAKESYNCKYEDMEEAKAYHEGYKEGLDECYGQMPIVGLVKENPPATVPGMADQAAGEMDEAVKVMRKDPFTGDFVRYARGATAPGAQAHRDQTAAAMRNFRKQTGIAGAQGLKGDYRAKQAGLNIHPNTPFEPDEMEEGNLFTGNLAKARAAGKSMADLDGDGDMEKVTEFAFEAWDKELNSLLTESEEVNEGMTVSISKGQQGAPDSVSVTAQDGEADQLLGLIKHAGLGLFGDEQMDHIGADANDQLMQKPGGIGVVGDHDGMMSLIKKVTGKDDHGHDDHDYADEEGNETDEETCSECGYMESKCQCDHEQVDEVESEDQMMYQVAEDNPPDSGAEETEEEIQDTAQANQAAADSSEELEEGKCSECGHDPCTCDHEESVEESLQLEEWANEAGKKGTDAQFEQDIEFMTKFIAGGLNKPKSTGQTTVPVIAGQVSRMEDPTAWARLAGIKK